MLHLEPWSLPLVELRSADGELAEADLFTSWYQQRTGEQPNRGRAFAGEQPSDTQALLTCGIEWLTGREERSEWAFVWEQLLKQSPVESTLQREEILRLGRSWLESPTHQQRPEWDKALEHWINSGARDGSLLQLGVEWILQHQSLSQSPPLAAKILHAAQGEARFDKLANWLAVWCRGNPDAGQTRFVISIFRSAQRKGMEIAAATPGWCTLVEWLAEHTQKAVPRASDADAARLQQLQEANQRVVGRIVSRLKTGFLVELHDPACGAFLPGSHVDLIAPNDRDAFVGIESEFEVQSVTRHVVVSCRSVLKAERMARQQQRWQELAVGDRVVGTVMRVVEYGVFINVEDAVGLLHVRDMSWQPIKTAIGFCEVGQELEVVVLRNEMQERGLAFGLKQLSPDPWLAAESRLVVGEVIEGVVVNLANNGAF